MNKVSVYSNTFMQGKRITPKNCLPLESDSSVGFEERYFLRECVWRAFALYRRNKIKKSYILFKLCSGCLKKVLRYSLSPSSANANNANSPNDAPPLSDTEKCNSNAFSANTAVAPPLVNQHLTRRPQCTLNNAVLMLSVVYQSYVDALRKVTGVSKLQACS